MKISTRSLLIAIGFSLTACGGGGNTGGGQGIVDTISPTVTFNPTTLTLASGATASVSLSATDNVGVSTGPSVACSNGGSFANGTYTAPETSTDVTSVCTATASDAAGNQGTATLTVTVTGSSGSANGVVGASSKTACENAAQNDASDCYVIEGTTASMYGVIGNNSLTDYQRLRQDFPDVTEIVLVNVPGSENDEVNVQVGRALHADGLNTRLLATSEIASGGVDYFLAGTQREIARGARIGVHSWSDGSGTNAASLPRNDQRHRLYLDYYEAIEYAQGNDFYFFTINAAPPESIHWMTEIEIETYMMATQSSAQSVSAKNGGVAYTQASSDNFGKHIVTIEPDSFANIIDGANSSDFIINMQGVHFIDGVAGNDRVILQGKSDDYLVQRVSDTTSIVFDMRGDQNLTLHLDNIDKIKFVPQTFN